MRASNLKAFLQQQRRPAAQLTTTCSMTGLFCNIKALECTINMCWFCLSVYSAERSVHLLLAAVCPARAPCGSAPCSRGAHSCRQSTAASCCPQQLPQRQALHRVIHVQSTRQSSKTRLLGNVHHSSLPYRELLASLYRLTQAERISRQVTLACMMPMQATCGRVPNIRQWSSAAVLKPCKEQKGARGALVLSPAQLGARDAVCLPLTCLSLQQCSLREIAGKVLPGDLGGCGGLRMSAGYSDMSLDEM
jgi:hypothetical protein